MEIYMTLLSILDLAAIPDGSTADQALRNARDLAIHAEQWGYHRFWVSEHHNMVGIASAATAVVIGYIAAATSKIRVGAGGIMLPNHAPLIVAEQFGTLEALYPGRIDLGLGRAPGSDLHTQRALRRGPDAGDQFPGDVQELQALLGPVGPKQIVQAVPGADSDVPLWILGSGMFGAQFAAAMGLPFAFASQFAPAALHEALRFYRKNFQPSEVLSEPYAIVAVNAVVAETNLEARYHFSSMQQHLANLVRNEFGKLPAPIEDIEAYWSAEEKMKAGGMLACSFVGTQDVVADGLSKLIAETAADEIIVVAALHSHVARLRSFELLSTAGL
jgi:luciferase family oxidoreductase group 1